MHNMLEHVGCWSGAHGLLEHVRLRALACRRGGCWNPWECTGGPGSWWTPGMLSARGVAEQSTGVRDRVPVLSPSDGGRVSRVVSVCLSGDPRNGGPTLYGRWDAVTDSLS